jgi:hypothetical protein
MERNRDTGARMDALIRGAEWAQTGTNGSEDSESVLWRRTPSLEIPLPKRLP